MSFCQKHDLEITGCSRQTAIFQTGVCDECIRSVYEDVKQIRQRWVEKVKEIREEYSIEVGKKQDEVSARRFAILIAEAFTSIFAGRPGVIDLMPIIEKDHFDLAFENRLYCDPIPGEEKVKPEFRKKVLAVWGTDKRSGMEGSTCNLKEWTIGALLEAQEKEVEDYESGGEVDLGSRTYEELGLEKAGIG
jgi:hypothetical protein